MRRLTAQDFHRPQAIHAGVVVIRSNTIDMPGAVDRRKPVELFAALPPPARLALHEAVLDEILEERVVSSRGRQVPRGVKRKMSNYPLRPRASQPIVRTDFIAAIQIVM